MGKNKLNPQDPISILKYGKSFEEKNCRSIKFWLLPKKRIIAIQHVGKQSYRDYINKIKELPATIEESEKRYDKRMRIEERERAAEALKMTANEFRYPLETEVLKVFLNNLKLCQKK